MSHRQFFSRVLFCMGILFSSIVPSLGMEELASTEREQAAYTAPADVSDNNFLPQVNEEVPYQVPLNVNNNNNVPLNDNEEAVEEVDEQDVENEPRVERPAVLAGYENARDFHARLLGEHPGWFGDNVQSYYKRIDPAITSTPLVPGINEWVPHTVFIDRARIMPNAQGEYIHDGISFNRNAFQRFDPTIAFTIPISDNTRPDNARPVDVVVPFIEDSRKKILELPQLEDYNACVAGAPGDQFFFRRRIKMRGVVRSQGGRNYMIEIEAENRRREAVTLQGMEFIFNKGAHTTQIVLDFVDAAAAAREAAAGLAAPEPAAARRPAVRELVDLMPPIEYRHSNEVADATVFCIKDRKVFNCAGKPIHSFFDTPATRRGWVPEGSIFYDQNNPGLVALPSRYADAGDRGENDADPKAWVLGEGHNSLYQRVQEQELVLQNATDYICCDNNQFYALLPYTATCIDYLSPNNRVRFDYLLQVKKPSCRIGGLVGAAPRNRASGLYQSLPINNIRRWQHIDPLENAHSVDFNPGIRVETIWPAEPLTAQEIIQWGDAGQRFFGHFHANIRHCNQALADKFNTWGRLNQLDLSRVQLADDVRWDRLFTAIGTMRQLTQFFFAYNHPATDIISSVIEQDNELVDILYGKYNLVTYSIYRNLATCLERLPNLRALHLQGLWLKNHVQLDSGCINTYLVSREVASLTRFIHDRELIIQTIIANICRLAHLESLSIDGIPNHGSSEWSREPLASKIIFSPAWLLLSPVNLLDKWLQETALERLVNDNADNLARMPSLRTISVHSPGGNCVDYFSQAFRARLAATRAAARAANPNLPALAINAEVLQ